MFASARSASSSISCKSLCILFEARDGVPDTPALVKRVLAFWQARDIFGTLRAQTASDKPWRFQDGPITAPNRMGVAHHQAPLG